MAEPRRGFREIEHTADLGIEAEGANPADLFAAAAEGFYSLIADTAGVEPKQEIHVVASGGGLKSYYRRGFRSCSRNSISAALSEKTARSSTSKPSASLVQSKESRSI